MRNTSAQKALALLAISIVLISLPAGGSPASALEPTPYPNSQAVVGDSISRGFNLSRNCFLKDCPAFSWATGTDVNVNSHSLRLKTKLTSLATFNLAKTGAKVSDLRSQLTAASTSKAQYVTVLIGANDVCTSSASTMTTESSFKTSFEGALTAYFAAPDPGWIFVASIPNVRQLYELFKGNSTARTTWSLYSICQSMLGSKVTETARQTVQNRLVAFNSIMENACKLYVRCKWDGGAVYSTAFTTGDVSTMDYFHPSATGQKKLAEITWQRSFWPNG